MVIQFRSIFLDEPPKDELSNYLDIESSGNLTPQTPRPARLAKAQYDVVKADKTCDYMESSIDLASGKEVKQRIVEKMHQAALTM